MHAACRLSPLVTAILCIISSEWCYNCHRLTQYATYFEFGFDCVYLGRPYAFIPTHRIEKDSTPNQNPFSTSFIEGILYDQIET